MPFTVELRLSSRASWRRALVVLALTVLLHLLWLFILSSSVMTRRRATAPPRIEVRLLPLASPTTSAQPQTPPRQRLQATPLEPRLVSTAPPSTAHAPAAPAAQAPASAPASGAEPALDLAVHAPRGAPTRPSIVQQALRDPRANTPRPTPLERLAQALGTDDALVEESLGDGRRRIRQGRHCVDLRTSRGAMIDPFSESLHATPKLAEDCSRR